MPNNTAVFTTRNEHGAQYGSSLYLVTPQWIFRCSGNTNGRRAETFARRREIVYVKPGAYFLYPAVGLYPVEGGHTGNNISAVLNITGEIPMQAPDNWNAFNGVPWRTARLEVLAAKNASRTELGVSGRFSRKVGDRDFIAD